MFRVIKHPVASPFYHILKSRIYISGGDYIYWQGKAFLSFVEGIAQVYLQFLLSIFPGVTGARTIARSSYYDLTSGTMYSSYLKATYA